MLTFCIGLNCSVKCAARSLTLFFSAESEMSAQYWNSSLGIRMPAKCAKTITSLLNLYICTVYYTVIKENEKNLPRTSSSGGLLFLEARVPDCRTSEPKPSSSSLNRLAILGSNSECHRSSLSDKQADLQTI